MSLINAFGGDWVNFTETKVDGTTYSKEAVTYAMNKLSKPDDYKNLSLKDKKAVLIKATNEVARERATSLTGAKKDKGKDKAVAAPATVEQKEDDISDMNYDDVYSIESEVAFTGFRMDKALSELMAVESDEELFKSEIKYILTFLFARGNNLLKMRQRGTIDTASLDKVESLINKYEIHSTVGSAGPFGMTFTRLQAAFPLICFQILSRMHSPPSDMNTGIPNGWRFSSASSLMYDIDQTGKDFFAKWMKWNVLRTKMLNKGYADEAALERFARTNYSNSMVPPERRDSKHAKFISMLKPP